MAEKYGYPVPDPVGQAIKTFDFMTKAMNYGEDRRRAQEKEDLQMESMRNQNKASALQLESAEEERQLKKICNHRPVCGAIRRMGEKQVSSRDEAPSPRRSCRSLRP